MISGLVLCQVIYRSMEPVEEVLAGNSVGFMSGCFCAGSVPSCTYL